jgi:hypothetical protein
MNARSLLNKRFPTILGLIILFGALGAGVFFIGSGPGIFSPRATPQTTPKNVKITNVTDTTFTVSFITDEATAGFVRYGTSATSLNNREGDDRDQLSGNVSNYTTHHITLRNLQANTTYYFTIGTGASGQFDNDGKPYSVKTVQRVTGQSAAQTIYGTVLNKDSTAADGSIVYVTVDKGAEMSALVRSSGTWAVPLSQLRGLDGGAPPEITTNTLMLIFVQGRTPRDTATLTTTVGQPQFPVKTITLGEENTAAPTAPPTTQTQSQPENQPTSTPQSGTSTQPEVTASSSATPTTRATATTRPTGTTAPTAVPSTVATTIPSNTPTAIPEEVSLPATDSEKPISGSAQDTMVVLVAGLLLISFGGVLYLSVRK